MNEILKQFSEDVAKQLKAKIESAEFAAFIEKVKAAGDDRTFEVVMSTSDEDRQGDALDQSGWDFRYFDMNPVLLWAHNYSSFPIGVITDIEVKGNETVATGKFAPAGMNPDADLACALYQEKILRAVSPGYIQNDDGTRELLEVSFCPVPAGRYALSMRQVRSLGLSTRELITKGFFFEKKADDDPKLGDSCEGDDGTPGVLAKDPKNPDRLICVPNESKSNETQSNMNDELQKNLKAEHERHGKAVMKSIEEFGEKCFGKSEKAKDDEAAKTIEEFEQKLEAEHTEHGEKCMKAVDGAYKIDPEEKKSIDEFKKAIEGENLEHVKCFSKAIEEFKAEPNEKALDEFTTKAEDELARHEKAHVDLCEKEFGEGQDDGKDEKAITEKSGRAISAATKEKLDAVSKSLDDLHDKHAKALSDLAEEHKKDISNATAAIKAIAENGDVGEEKPGEKASPNARSSSSGAAINKDVPMTDLETYLFTQRLLRQVKSASEDGLRQIKDDLKTKFPSRR